MQIYPDISIHEDKLIYPTQTEAYEPLMFGDNPVQVAVRWKNMGVQWLHIENHDLQPSAYLLHLIQQLASMGLGVQVHSVITSLSELAELFQVGASRIFIPISSAADLLENALANHGAEAVGVSFTPELSELVSIEHGKSFYTQGLRYALYTDTPLVGSLEGVALPRLINFSIKTQLAVINKGGVAHLNDLVKLKATRQIEGVIIGRALYDGRIQLSDALALTK